MRLRYLNKFFFIFIFIFSILYMVTFGSFSTYAQSSLAIIDPGNALPGQAVTLSLTLQSDEDISSISTDISYDKTTLSKPTVVIGSAGTSSDKIVVSSEVDDYTFRLGVLSFTNNTRIRDGAVAEITFVVSGTATPGTQTLLIQSSSGSNPYGDEVPIVGQSCKVDIQYNSDDGGGGGGGGGGGCFITAVQWIKNRGGGE